MSKNAQGISNTIRRHRLRKGWSQAALGQMLGLGRQAVYDMECGRYLPNTAVALAMAKLFACSVESLFHTAVSDCGAAPRLVPHFAAHAERALHPGSRLALAYVRGELVGVPLEFFGTALLPAADAYVQSDGTVDVTSPPQLIRQTLLLFGCNPALELLDSHMKRRLFSSRVRCIFASSGRALDTLAGGNAHIAATHFHSGGGDDANAREAHKRLCGRAGRLVGFCANEEGLMVAPGNPLAIRTVADIAEKGVRFVNREQGAALRRLLDDHLARAGVPAEAVAGYDTQVYSHHEGACRVAFGAADAALGLGLVAASLGLDFIPLASTTCDLVIPDDVLADPAVDALMQALCSSRLRNELHGLPGFDASGTGSERPCAAGG
ncbi:helix-turn-helix domain-containing protein [Desulfovibrio sp. OttesenSCG-928-G15]|nr:helix-turn-helix domain-containing protein [Desulfovibrio sp. OttesenSCG-928-G15]